MPSFDAIRFLADHFPDRATLRETLRLRGVEPPTFGAMRKWTERGQIPAEWLPNILYALETARGEATLITPYMGDVSCDSRPSKARFKPTGGCATIFD